MVAGKHVGLSLRKETSCPLLPGFLVREATVEELFGANGQQRISEQS